MDSGAVTQSIIPQTRTDLQALIIDRLLKIQPELAAKLSMDKVDSVTLQSLGLDSLDTLQWAMEIEEAYGVEIEAVDFDPKLTLSGLAIQVEALKQKQAKG